MKTACAHCCYSSKCDCFCWSNSIMLKLISSVFEVMVELPINLAFKQKKIICSIWLVIDVCGKIKQAMYSVQIKDTLCTIDQFKEQGLHVSICMLLMVAYIFFQRSFKSILIKFFNDFGKFINLCWSSKKKNSENIIKTKN